MQPTGFNIYNSQFEWEFLQLPGVLYFICFLDNRKRCAIVNMTMSGIQIFQTK